jgi:deazaflavin-dependent oxidoreductase (nitroreductase family)
MADGWNAKIIEEFRANEGRVGGPFERTPLLLLHTKGAKTGEERVNPLAYMRDGDRHAVFASKGGAPTNPDWYHNLVANPEVTIEVGTESIKGRAYVATDPERTELWTRQVGAMPAFGEYEKKSGRTIPVIVIEPL